MAKGQELNGALLTEEEKNTPMGVGVWGGAGSHLAKARGWRRWTITNLEWNSASRFESLELTVEVCPAMVEGGLGAETGRGSGKG
jgi:hypothetical protein